MKRKNFLIALLLSVAVSCGAFALSSCDYFGTSSSSSIEQPPTEGILYEISEDGTYAIVTEYEGVATEVFIANTYNGVPVTSIGNSAFYCTNLTSVVIPDSVTSIGDLAFAGCTGLTSVVIPDSVTSIGNAAFSDCYSLTSVVIPDSVTSIDNYAFQYCTSLTSVVIPDSVTSIGNDAFAHCTSLTSVVIGDSVTSIGNQAFYDCPKLQFNKYGNCKYLGNENNPYYALIKSTKILVSSYTIHEDAKVIADSAFSNCGSLTSVVIPDGVISIGAWAFSNCDDLTSVFIPDSVTSIVDLAFHSCDSLTSVVIGDSVTSIGEMAFYDCTSLTSITVSANNTAYQSIDGNLYSKDGKTLIQYAIGKTAISFTIPDSVTSIGRYVFSSCTNLTSVLIPDSVTSIGYRAFYNCDSLTSVVIGDSVTSIGEMAFYDCTSLTSVYYQGRESEWAEIKIGSDVFTNTNATRYYYSASTPTTEGNFWHYDENGNIVIW